MKIALFGIAAALAGVIGLAAPCGAQGVPPIAALREVPFTEVRIEDSFWAPRRETNRKASLRHSLAMLEREGYVANLDLAAQGKTEGYRGLVFSDSDLYKVLESIAYSLATDPDPELAAQTDALIAKLAAAQRPDGYLNTWFQVKEPTKRFVNLRDWHELYCAGHLFEAAVAHYQATGKRTLLDVATKYADLLCRTYGPGGKPGYCGHPEIELALVKLARVTENAAYFDLAKHFIDTRGSSYFAAEHQTPLGDYDGQYWQDNCPVREHDRVVGHAVRFAYLMSGVVDIGVQARDESLLSMARRVWRNTTERNTYITGGIGPSAHNEGFTTDYDLPNLSAYQETCASVSMVLWNHRLNLAYADGKYADVMETALYNGALAGVSLDGERFFYVNPLASRGGHHRSEWFGCACCPPNITRLLSSLGSYAYAANDEGLWVNLYIQGGVRTTIGGEDVHLDVTTDYPWNGRVRVAVQAAPADDMALHLRIPGWCEGAAVSVNNHKEADAVFAHGYLTITRGFRAGDTVDLDLPMPIRRVEAHPHVESDRGQLAIARGPMIYCLEACDNVASIWTLAIPADAALSAEKRTDLLGGVVTIRGEALAASRVRWNVERALYRTAAAPTKVPFTAVPYCAWDNRKPGPMQVWFPSAPPPPVLAGPEANASVSISFKNWNCDPAGINDGAEPKDSAELPASNCHWWNHKGGTEWVGYTWEKPVTLAASMVYWFDDSGHGECKVPKSWRLLYSSGGEWKPVAVDGNYPITTDGWCEVGFAPITASELRLEVIMQDGWACGVHEWKVAAPDTDD